MISNSERKRDRSSGLAALNNDEFKILEVVGGWRNVIETVLPTLIFVIGLVITKDFRAPALLALGVMVVLLALRLFAKKSFKHLLLALITMGASVYVAWKTGESVNVFLVSILKNSTYGSIVLVSILVRWPLLGVMLGYLRGEKTAWRHGEEWKLTRVRYYQITIIWLCVFIARLSVQLPLYFGGYAQWLGVTKLALGMPTDIVAAYLCWLLLRTLPKKNQVLSNKELTTA